MKAELRAWVSARLIWDLNQDYQLLIDNFSDGYYETSSQIKIELM